MIGDVVSTRLQKEMGSMQQEISKIHEEMARLEATIDSKFQGFREEFRGDLQALLSKYFDKGKGVLGAPPGFPQKEPDTVLVGPNFVVMSSVNGKGQSSLVGAFDKVSRLECLKFEGNDFRGWWTKLEQYFEAKGILESNKVRLVMLNLEGRALEWHHFYSQRNGGLQILSWPAYFKSLQDRFGFGQFGNPMKEIVTLKQQGTVEQYQDMFVGLLNQLHLPESYALSIFLNNLKSEIGHYLDLFEPTTLVEDFQLARKIKVLLACPAKKSSTPSSNSPRSLLNLSVISGYSSSPTRSVPASQSVSNATVNKPGVWSILPAVLAERRQKGDVDEFHECSDKLEEENSEEDQLKSPVILLHALNGLQGHNTIRVVTRVGSTLAIILVDSGSTHNFIDAKLVNKLSLPVTYHEKLKVTVANGTCLFTRGLCREVLWEVQVHHFATDFLVLPLKRCDMVLGVQWLLMLGDIIWNFSSLTIQFMVKGQTRILQGIIPGSLAIEKPGSNPKCFVTTGQPLGLYAMVMSTPKQTALLAITIEDSAIPLQAILDKFKDGQQQLICFPDSNGQEEGRELTALMNSIFKPLLRICVLVFFDDILVYSSSWTEHLQHLREVLSLLQNQQLFTKKSKYCFGTTQIEYLGHVLGTGTVAMDKSKRYYRRFIRHYGLLAKPLTDLLKKNRWSWNCSCAVTTRATSGLLQKGINNGAVDALSIQPQLDQGQFFQMATGGTVSYKKGINNRAADALSRQPQLDHGQFFQMATSSVISNLLARVQSLYETDDKLKKIIQDVRGSDTQHHKYSWDGRFLRKRGKIVVRRDLQFRRDLFKHFHASAVGRHLGIHECLVCQRCKGETVASLGLLQPLLAPERAWSVISLDFIEGLPNSNKKNSILVVVDHLTKYGHFVALSHLYTAKDVAQEYLNNVYKLHGVVSSVGNQTLTVYSLPPLNGWSNGGLKQAREAARKLLHFHFKRAYSRMKYFADRHCSDMSFNVGDLLPPGSRIHPTFYVSQLKKHIGSSPAQVQLPLHDDHGAMQKQLVRLVDRRIVKKSNQAVTEVLVEWIDSFPEYLTWESLTILRTKFPHCHP
ncbi:hypothetical protein CXB51_008586 [Gossypium anomalum]|uniref:Reverse transcriptase domain-containing protein n=1 Tax=Gossypium anomalum TaxID=47600 RepID=A0A8J6D3L8_9ROSI|nr:hypothetical protein CXB51_008586 [Gossypium anomalum]